jgi:hypothetical protein
VKILIYSHYFLPSVGGVERLVAAMATAFTEKGHHVCVITATAAAWRILSDLCGSTT